MCGLHEEVRGALLGGFKGRRINAADCLLRLFGVFFQRSNLIAPQKRADLNLNVPQETS